MSVLDLPEPANWAKTGKQLFWVAVAASVIVGYFIVRGVLAGVRGNYLTAVAVFGFMAFPILYGAVLLLAAAGKARARTTCDTNGFTVRPDKKFSALYFTGLMALLPSSIVLAIFVPRGAIDIPMTRGMQVFSPVVFLMAAAIAVVGLVAGVRRGGIGYLRFTPASIEIADVLKTSPVEWTDIVDVKDHSASKDGGRAGRSVVLCLSDGTEKVIGGLNLYVATGVPMYWMVRHYWRHPENREELVGSQAAARLREGRFDLG